MINMISTINMIRTISMISTINTTSMENRKVRMEIDIEIVETTIGKRRRVNRGEDTHGNNRDRNGRKKEVKTKMKNEALAVAEKTRRTRKTKKKMRSLIIDDNLINYVVIGVVSHPILSGKLLHINITYGSKKYNKFIKYSQKNDNKKIEKSSRPMDKSRTKQIFIRLIKIRSKLGLGPKNSKNSYIGTSSITCSESIPKDVRIRYLFNNGIR